MEWVKNKRFSTRQKREIDYDGFTGEVKLTGDIGTFLPFLEAGEILSVGKNTAFGFGKYRLKNLKWQ
jgi:CRISPR/Cas system endoribonuclease Cas6 (RAMP superfamily)